MGDMETPMHLLRPDESHSRLDCVPEALELLDALGDDTPVTVVALVGTQRGGKSTLLNLLYDRKTKGFGLGHFMDPQTHGLWMWVRPHPRNPSQKVVYIDTEGLDAPLISPFYNWSLSALTLLISDLYVYQSKGSIDSSSVDRLAMILRVAEQLKGHSGGESDGGAAGTPSKAGGGLGNTPSSFLWLLRDHHLGMKSATPKEEMLEKLDASALQTIKRCFGDYDCFPLPRPVDQDGKLRELDDLSYEDLTNAFREEFVVLERRVLDRLRMPRKLGGQLVTGPVLASLLRRYTAAVSCQQGSLSDIAQLPTQREMLVRMAGDRAVKAGLQCYQDALQAKIGESGGLPMPMTRLWGMHEACERHALDVFRSQAVLDAAETEEYADKLRARLAKWGLQPCTKPGQGGGAGQSGSSSSSSLAGNACEDLVSSQENAGPNTESHTRTSVQEGEGGGAALPLLGLGRDQMLVSGKLADVIRSNSRASLQVCQSALARLSSQVQDRLALTLEKLDRDDDLGTEAGAEAALSPFVHASQFDSALVEVTNAFQLQGRQRAGPQEAATEAKGGHKAGHASDAAGWGPMASSVLTSTLGAPPGWAQQGRIDLAVSLAAANVRRTLRQEMKTDIAAAQLELSTQLTVVDTKLGQLADEVHSANEAAEERARSLLATVEASEARQAALVESNCAAVRQACEEMGRQGKEALTSAIAAQAQAHTEALVAHAQQQSDALAAAVAAAVAGLEAKAEEQRTTLSAAIETESNAAKEHRAADQAKAEERHAKVVAAAEVAAADLAASEERQQASLQSSLQGALDQINTSLGATKDAFKVELASASSATEAELTKVQADVDGVRSGLLEAEERRASLVASAAKLEASMVSALKRVGGEAASALVAAVAAARADAAGALQQEKGAQDAARESAVAALSETCKEEVHKASESAAAAVSALSSSVHESFATDRATATEWRQRLHEEVKDVTASLRASEESHRQGEIVLEKRVTDRCDAAANSAKEALAQERTGRGESMEVVRGQVAEFKMHLKDVDESLLLVQTQCEAKLSEQTTAQAAALTTALQEASGEAASRAAATESVMTERLDRMGVAIETLEASSTQTAKDGAAERTKAEEAAVAAHTAANERFEGTVARAREDLVHLMEQLAAKEAAARSADVDAVKDHVQAEKEAGKEARAAMSAAIELAATKAVAEAKECSVAQLGEATEQLETKLNAQLQTAVDRVVTLVGETSKAATQAGGEDAGNRLSAAVAEQNAAHEATRVALKTALKTLETRWAEKHSAHASGVEAQLEAQLAAVALKEEGLRLALHDEGLRRCAEAASKASEKQLLDYEEREEERRTQHDTAREAEAHKAELRLALVETAVGAGNVGERLQEAIDGLQTNQRAALDEAVGGAVRRTEAKLGATCDSLRSELTVAWSEQVASLQSKSAAESELQTLREALASEMEDKIESACGMLRSDSAFAVQESKEQIQTQKEQSQTQFEALSGEVQGLRSSLAQSDEESAAAAADTSALDAVEAAKEEMRTEMTTTISKSLEEVNSAVQRVGQSSEQMSERMSAKVEASAQASAEANKLAVETLVANAMGELRSEAAGQQEAGSSEWQAGLDRLAGELEALKGETAAAVSHVIAASIDEFRPGFKSELTAELAEDTKGKVDAVQQRVVEVNDNLTAALKRALQALQKDTATLRADVVSMGSKHDEAQGQVAQRDTVQAMAERLTAMQGSFDSICHPQEGKIEEVRRALEGKMSKAVAGMARDIDASKENAASLWESLGVISCRVTDVQTQVDDRDNSKNMSR